MDATILKAAFWISFVGWVIAFMGLQIWSYRAQQHFMNLYRQRINPEFPLDFTHVSLLNQMKMSREVEGELANAQADPEVEAARREARRRKSIVVKGFLIGPMIIVVMVVVMGVLSVLVG